MCSVRSFITVWLAAVACALLAGLSGCGGGDGGDNVAPPAVPTQPGSRVVDASVNSTKTGYTYKLQIYLPASYAVGSASYPTIYALDGDAAFAGSQTRFDSFRAILERRQINAILVGIGGTERRQTDFNFPGAVAYHEFIALELIPFVESRFRTDASKRVLSGLSTGGNFAASALFLEAPSKLVFTHFISAEGAFWQQLSEIQGLEQQMFDAVKGKDLPATLILARSSQTQGTNASYVLDLYRRMAARGYVGLTLTQTVWSFGHVEMDSPSFEDAIATIFN